MFKIKRKFYLFATFVQHSNARFPRTIKAMQLPRSQDEVVGLTVVDSKSRKMDQHRSNNPGDFCHSSIQYWGLAYWNWPRDNYMHE